MTRVPDLCCRDGLSPFLGFPGRLVPPDSGRIQSGILCYLGGPERRREGGVRGCFWSFAESKAGPSEARSCHATAPRSSSSEAAVSATRHCPSAAGKCGRAAAAAITPAGTKQAII